MAVCPVHRVGTAPLQEEGTVGVGGVGGYPSVPARCATLVSPGPATLAAAVGACLTAGLCSGPHWDRCRGSTCQAPVDSAPYAQPCHTCPRPPGWLPPAAVCPGRGVVFTLPTEQIHVLGRSRPRSVPAFTWPGDTVPVLSWGESHRTSVSPTTFWAGRSGEQSGIPGTARGTRQLSDSRLQR